MLSLLALSSLFFFNATATTEIYTLSHTTLFRSYNLALGDRRAKSTMNYLASRGVSTSRMSIISYGWWTRDRKSTRLNSSHQIISYAVFCLKKKKKNHYIKII